MVIAISKKYLSIELISEKYLSIVVWSIFFLKNSYIKNNLKKLGQ
jgi:hypothetical protein